MSKTETTKQQTDGDLMPLMTDNVDKHKIHQTSKRRKTIIITLIIFAICLISTYIIVAYITGIFPFKESEKIEFQPGLYGKWSIHGGNIQNQQRAPNQNKIQINQQNVKDLSFECTYKSQGGQAFIGYPTVDNDNNAYFCDRTSGYIISINLDNNCSENWRSHIGELLGHNKSLTVNNHQTLTIFQDSVGDKGLLFGTPTRLNPNNDLFEFGDFSCYAVAIHLINGSLWWKIAVGNGTANKINYLCALHGFRIENNYAYGGMTKGNDYYIDASSKYISRYFKIDIDSHKLINQWYPLNDLNKTNFDEYNKSYRGMSVYGMNDAIIEDYIIFGTSNLHAVPQYIEDCVGYSLNHTNTSYNPYLSLEQSVSQDICGNDQSNNALWRCLERGVYVDSLVILNKNNFEMVRGIPLQGLDIFTSIACIVDDDPPSHCPKYKQTIMNADVLPVAAYKDKHNGKLYAVLVQKSGRLHVFDIESGQLKFSKQFTPQSTNAIFSLAIDVDADIAITVNNGMPCIVYPIRYTLLNNVTVCDFTSSIHAFNLSTGATIWQQIHPYGTINESKCFNDSIPWNYDSSAATTCEKGPFLNMNEYMTVKNVDVLSVFNDTILPIRSKERARFRAPLTIVKDMVFVPSDSGDIWVVDLFTGATIHHFTCPNVLNNFQWNRPGIRGGVTVFEDRVIFYCGSYWGAEGIGSVANGTTFVSMKLTSNGIQDP
eukprot:72756_1